MNKACLCEECLNDLIELIKEDNPDITFNNREPYLSSHTPCVELHYNAENGREYTKYCNASSNYCCECGEAI